MSRKMLTRFIGTLCLFVAPIAYSESQSKLAFSTLKQAVSNPFKSQEQMSASSQASILLWNRLRNQFTLPSHDQNSRVQFYIKRYTQSQAHFNDIIYRAQPYLYYILEEIEKRGLPTEIALLPIVESSFDPTALSSSGARGLWQIMPETGKYYGLDQDEWFDGCQDIKLSTRAALGHLQYLGTRFKGNWILALAAYNSGEGRVMRAMKKNLQENKSTEFWHLTLPQETRDYVPKLMALVSIIKSPNKYGIVLPNLLNQPYFTHINVGKAIDIKEAAKLANFPEKKLTHLNPGFYKKKMNPDGPFELCVPIHLTERFAAIAPKLAAVQKPRPALHRIRKGETLSKIALQYRTDIHTLKKLNKLPNDVIRVGQSLKLPSQTDTLIASLPKKPIIYVVKQGDSLSRISQKHQVDMKKIMAQNKLSAKSTLHPGQQIIIEKA